MLLWVFLFPVGIWRSLVKSRKTREPSGPSRAPLTRVGMDVERLRAAVDGRRYLDAA